MAVEREGEQLRSVKDKLMPLILGYLNLPNDCSLKKVQSGFPAGEEKSPDFSDFAVDLVIFSYNLVICVLNFR